jgi:hypothetical protein
MVSRGSKYISSLTGTLFCLAVVIGLGCNEELGPLNEPSGFSGVIHFKNWPPATDIKEMRLVAIEEIPKDSTSVIPLLLAGKAAVYPPVPGDYFQTLVDTIIYEFTNKSGTNLQVKNYPYVAVWYQYGPNILRDWRPAGIYTTGPGAFDPAPVRVVLHRVVPHVDILVDFKNLPPLPWQ